MIITIGGLAGTGTTTLAEVLSEKLNVPYISAGFIFREMAAERGMSVLEFSEFAEGNAEIDKEIDKRQAEKAKSSDNLILEGRLSAFFVENADLKICLMTPFEVRSKRIAQREGKSVDVAKNEIIIREESESLRYKEIHNIDIRNMEIYDLIINTDSFNPESISEIITTTLKVI
ncbi:cytidylate kinase [Methanobrevibacter gottschalkii]|uniref:Cytidylate kinase n=2 Tax=Methanobrevibacter gottschalkii TaxID=190974 RepID=A0A3N5B235_9EURY|nr:MULTISPECIES: AAA family ATPase [Methanobrevibacter]MCQ2970749.1 AAA family ATPase [archaeon]OEC97040.1 cytidylate kinase [Methanobrevibacter sp. A27]RPF51646.1 cytidylate kinase [Methanobrevibacter gottschalkii DSM 11977]SEL27184.1 cytidylate kinase [Methanobrevibacter gottschalkii]